MPLPRGTACAALGECGVHWSRFLGVRDDNLLRTLRLADHEELCCRAWYAHPLRSQGGVSWNANTALGLLVGCIVAAACGYFDRSGIDAAPVGSFIWVHTFRLSVYGPLVLPLLAVYIVLPMEAIGVSAGAARFSEMIHCIVRS